ncbi:glycosyltransferase family protein [Sphingobacterium sp. WOUb80]|uniref:glycosyltransferase family protein n=1 Tax=Sphingobacterium sp. WOUb80 TaxID=3234028 RepID=UPI003CE9C323
MILPEDKKTLLIHCQYVYGLGHYVRMMELAKGLTDSFNVYFVNGGEPVLNFDIPEDVNLIQIPAIYKQEETGILLPVDKHISLDVCFAARQNLIADLIEKINVDIVITEHFPFGLLFESEVRKLIEYVKHKNYNARVICSVREIIDSSKGSKRDDYICEILNQLYDLVLVHGDRQHIQLSDSFPLIDRIKVPIIHTGYIVSKEIEPRQSQQPNTILVSIAGGRLGDEILEALIDCHLSLSKKLDHKMILFSGAFQSDFQKQQTKVAALLSDKIELKEFNRREYLSEMGSAKMIISLGGYNSMIESLSIGKSLLVYNRTFIGNNVEQDLRIGYFKRKGCLEVLNFDDLKSSVLIEKIISQFNRPTLSGLTIDINGVSCSVKKILELVNSKSNEYLQ